MPGLPRPRIEGERAREWALGRPIAAHNRAQHRAILHEQRCIAEQLGGLGSQRRKVELGHIIGIEVLYQGFE